jgi:hypothetical protein
MLPIYARILTVTQLDSATPYMTDWNALSNVAADFRRHFDQYYLGVIPRLLNEEGKFLAFVSTLTAIEALAGIYDPNASSGERFRRFVTQYFPEVYKPFAAPLWKFRNRMIHAFNPSPFLLVCHNSRMHLAKASDTPMLNAEDFYADTLTASRAYFADLYSIPKLQQHFQQRITQDDGGHIHSAQIVETVLPNKSAT